MNKKTLGKKQKKIPQRTMCSVGCPRTEHGVEVEQEKAVIGRLGGKALFLCMGTFKTCYQVFK